MKIALIGYGKMGKTIEQIALGRGHQIVSIVDINNPEEIHSDKFKSADVAIEFTTPATIICNVLQQAFRLFPVRQDGLTRLGKSKICAKKRVKLFSMPPISASV